MTQYLKLSLGDLSKADPQEVWAFLPPGADELVAQLLALSIGMSEEAADTASVPIWDQRALKRLLREAVAGRFEKKEHGDAMMMAQFAVLTAINVGSRELLKALVSNMSEDYGEAIKEISVCRESNVGRA